ncbi:transcription antitermination protein NusB, partial [Anaerotardibacter muris]|uniref:transcription antitermination protein NusB n=1 Tax=Anaerotardibacter muris TaxID=2941505 RepID=UPI00203F39E3
MAEKQQHDRSEGRRMAVQVLYQSEILEEDPVKIIDGGQLASETQLLTKYARRLIDGATENKDAIDAQIIEASENWALDRMPIVDRSLLRMAAYLVSSCVSLASCPPS